MTDRITDKETDKIRNSEMLTRLFYKLLPVQILIVAMGAVNSIVDGVVAGRCIDARTVGVVGLYYAFVSILSAVGSVMLGGTSVLSGHAMGKGDLNKTKGIFSLNVSTTVIVGIIITALSLLFPWQLAKMLGASEELMKPLVLYIRGYAIGIIPLLLAQQIAAFLQMERRSARGYAGVVGMITSNIVMNILLVVVFHLGIFGLALSTSLSNWIYLLIMAQYYFTGKSQLGFVRSLIDIRDLKKIIVIGFPGATLVLCIALRSLTINRILLTYAGTDGLSAQAALNMVCGLFIAFALGVGATVRLLTSVFIGEGDKDSIKRLLGIAFKRMVPLSAVVTVVVLLLSKPVTSMFFADKTSEVFRLTHQLFVIYALCIPMIVLCQIIVNYLQASGHNAFVNVVSVFDGYFSVVVPSLIQAPVMGALGVWIANPIGMVLTLLLDAGYVIYCCKGFPKSLDDCLLLKPGFSVPDEDRLEITIRNVEDVISTAERVQEFCLAHGVDGKTATYSALCLEEMADNVVEHGFTKEKNEKRKHTIELRVIYEEESIMLRIKDDCVPYDPAERAALLQGDDVTHNIGLRMVTKLSKDMTYHNLMGLNVLTIYM